MKHCTSNHFTIKRNILWLVLLDLDATVTSHRTYDFPLLFSDNRQQNYPMFRTRCAPNLFYPMEVHLGLLLDRQ